MHVMEEKEAENAGKAPQAAPQRRVKETAAPQGRRTAVNYKAEEEQAPAAELPKYNKVVKTGKLDTTDAE